jgi:DNA invertase Pin-like site-specific DNA recombinase
MPERQFVAYYRVSTAKQGFSGLGLEAQREAVRRFLTTTPGKLVSEFMEVRSGFKGSRPQLAEALRVCRMRRAVLLIARLDRLARSVSTISALMDSEVEFVAVDFPQASRLTLHVLAAIAEYESRLTSERIKSAFAAAKARGVVIERHSRGFIDLRKTITASVQARKAEALTRARDVAPIIKRLLEKGKLRVEIAAELNRLKIPTPRQSRWNAQGLRRVLALLGDGELSRWNAGTALDWRTARADARWRALAPLLWSLRRGGLSIDSIAAELNRRGIPAPRGGAWVHSTVYRILCGTASFMGEPKGCGRADSRARWAKAHRRAQELAPLIDELRQHSMTLREIAGLLNDRGMRTARGRLWTHSSVWQALCLASKSHGDSIAAGNRGSFRVVRLDQTQRAVRVAALIWRLKALGNSTIAIAEEMNRRQIRPMRCGRWRRAAVERIMRLTEHTFPDLAKAVSSAPNPWLTQARQRAAEIAPVVRELRATMTLAEVATELTRRGVSTRLGNRVWTDQTVRRTLLRADEWTRTMLKAAA